MYFISKDNKKEGPYPLDEVVKLNLTDDILVWKEGLTSWTQPSELPELANVVIKTPPPLPIDIQKQEEKDFIEFRRRKASKIVLNNALIGLFVALVLTGLATAGGQSGGTNTLPVYLTNEERNSPVTLYWHFFPTCLLIGEIIMLCVSLYKISLINPQQKQNDEKSN